MIKATGPGQTGARNDLALNIWLALPGEPVCQDRPVTLSWLGEVARHCVLVADHGTDIAHAAPDGTTW